MTRQFLLVGVAALLGALVLRFGFDDPAAVGPDAQPQPTATPVPAEQPTAVLEPTAPAREPASVTVLVANSTGIAGLAGNTTADIGASLLHSMLDAVDSTGPTLDTTAVFYQPSYQAQAAAVAEFLGVDSAGLAVMPATPPVEDLGGAHVLVVLGLDLAPPAG